MSHAPSSNAAPKFGEHASQILATEHWSLLAGRSLVYTEAFSRVTVFLTVMSASIVAMALVVNTAGLGDMFTWAILLLAPLVLFLGVTTYIRLVQINLEDAFAIVAINRLRHAYIRMEPELAPFLSTGWHDDDRGFYKSILYMGTKVSRPGWHFIITTPTVIAIINGFLAGTAAGLILHQSVGSPGAGIGVGAGVFIAVAAALFGMQMRAYREFESRNVRFPSQPSDYADELPPVP
jgi:hypothetical protein